MGTLIAEARGYKFSMSEIYKEILGLIGLAYLAQQTAIGLYKTILPFLGAITTIPLVFILTYAIGKVMDYYFVSKTEGKKVTKDDLINAFKQARKDAKKNFTKDEIKKKTNAAKADMANYKPTIKEFVQKNIDELAVISVISKLRSGEKIVSEEENIILEAMIRSSNKITDLDSAIEFAKTTAAKGTDSLMGAANNIKGIAHELIYIKTENEDGDSVFAFMPEDTNHPQFDVLTINNTTGEQKWEQLKTTTNSDHINSWIEKYQFQIFGSLSFKEYINHSIRQKSFQHFWNKVDSYYFGNNRKNRIERICFNHVGYSNTNLHFHFLTRCPIFEDTQKFNAVLNLIWFEMKESGKYSKIELINDNVAVAKYVGHETYKLGTDTINTETSHLTH